MQAEGAAAYPPSLAAGQPVSIWTRPTMADGIKVGRPGDVPFGIVGELVDEVRTVSEDDLSSALLLCLERAKLVVEPAGASPVAALLARPGVLRGPGRGGAVGRQRRPAADAADPAARHGRGGPLPVAAAAADGPARGAGDAARGVVSGRR